MQDQSSPTPAEELRAAATMLRETAAKATRGPWVYHPTISRHLDTEGAEYAWTICRPLCETDGGPACESDCGANVLKTGAEDCEEDNVRIEDVQWMTIAHPGIAEPLAAWLEGSAKHAAKVRDPRNQEIVADQDALKVARVINGGQS